MKKRIFSAVAIFVVVILLAMRLSRRETFAALTVGRNLCGNGMWVKAMARCEDGRVDRMAAKARWAGLRFVIIKTHDGGQAYNFKGSRVDGADEMCLTKHAVEQFHKAGIAVFAWGFNYGRTPEREARMIQESIHRGADGYVFDAEGHFSNRAEAAQRLCFLVTEHLGTCARCTSKPLAYSSYANPAQHRSFPYEIFNRVSFRTLPQTYWNFGHRSRRSPQFVVTRFFSQWKTMQDSWREQGKPELSIPAVPTGQCHKSVPAAEVTQFIQATRNYHGRAFWLWDTIGEAQWQAIRTANVRPFDPVAIVRETGRPIIE